jgi:hypothetical protein
VIKLVFPFSGNRKKGGAENIALQNLRVPGMEVSKIIFRQSCAILNANGFFSSILLEKFGWS